MLIEDFSSGVLVFAAFACGIIALFGFMGECGGRGSVWGYGWVLGVVVDLVVGARAVYRRG